MPRSVLIVSCTIFASCAPSAPRAAVPQPEPAPATAATAEPPPTATIEAPRPSPPPPAPGWSITKAEFIDGMTQRLPPEFCKLGSFFRECFRVSESDCLANASRTTKSCLTQHDEAMPQTFQQPHDGQAWGEKIGECAGRAYELSNLSRKKSEPRCNDPANWE